MAKKLSKRKEILVKAMKKFYCNISSACEASNTSRNSYYQWYKNDALFREAVDDLRSQIDDNIETKAVAKCLNGEGDTSMIQFMLKTRMKHRGYVEKTEIEQVGELRIMQESPLDFSKLSVEELRALKALSDKAKK